jgi:hypothetical protein
VTILNSSIDVKGSAQANQNIARLATEKQGGKERARAVNLHLLLHSHWTYADWMEWKASKRPLAWRRDEKYHGNLKVQRRLLRGELQLRQREGGSMMSS